MLYLANKYSITTVKLRVSFRDVISLYTQISASQFSDRLHPGLSLLRATLNQLRWYSDQMKVQVCVGTLLIT